MAAVLAEQLNYAGAAAAFGFWLALAVVTVVGLWKVFEKAHRAGFLAVIPIYNLYIVLRMTGRPGWALILLFIPFVNVLIWIVVLHGLSRCFGHGVLFTLGLLIALPLFVCILGFGRSRYLGPGAA